MQEWTMLLDMDDEQNLSGGDWVTVRHGLYKGDVGYVQSIQNWGQVKLLLVPRLPCPPGVGSSSRKRKWSSIRTNPCQFTKEMLMLIAMEHSVTRLWQG